MGPLGAVVLAGGRGRRFGSDKRLASLPSGDSLLEATLCKIIPAFEETLLVLRPGDESLATALSARFKTLTTTLANDAGLGMGHSLAHGAAKITHWQGAAICLGDMPFHAPNTLSTLILAFRAASQSYPIIQPCHQGRPGHPVLFHRAYFDAMRALTGDQGARTLLKAEAPAVQMIEVDDLGILQDVDAPKDLASG